jgi:tRNA1Val (adenine37-N6)-methyltransferase
MNKLAERSGLILRKVKLPHGEAPVYQSAVGQGISSDAAELAGVVLAENGESPIHALELGCGAGIVSLVLAGYRPDWRIIGVDIQPQLVDLARLNASLTGAKTEFYTGDIVRPDFLTRRYDLIVGNPPYYPVSMGRISPRPEKAAARHELFCTLEDVIRCVDAGLADHGAAYLLYPSFRDAELTARCSDHGLDPEIRRAIPCRRPGAATHIWRIRRVIHVEN